MTRVDKLRTSDGELTPLLVSLPNYARVNPQKPLKTALNTGSAAQGML
jgi:hypothetical protein